MRSLAVQADGKILVGGLFNTLGGQPRRGIGRLNADWTLDAGFNPGATHYDRGVLSLVVQADGKILVGGDIETLGGQLRRGFGRLNANGTLDTGFNPELGAASPAWPVVRSLAVQADGKILVGGKFTTLRGQPRSNIGRLNPDGTLDAGFNPGVLGGYYVVHSLAVQADGKILVSGEFTNLCGQARNGIGRLNADGTLDAGFNPGMTGRLGQPGYADSLVLQADGKILVCGQFTTLGGQPRRWIGRLNADGTLDAGFDPGTQDENTFGSSLAVQADGKILVGGFFNSLGGQPRRGICRLNATEPATQSLAFDGSAITWLRGGTSPEVWRTTFEYSSDGFTWTFLGAGTRIPGGWQLTGLSLPPGGTIRARGHVTGGQGNGSSWFVETRSGPPTVLSQPSSRTNSAFSSASFFVVASGSEPLGFQWYKDGVALADGQRITGARTSWLKLSGVLNSDEGGYQLVVTNAQGSVTSTVATLTIDPATPDMGFHPAVGIIASGWSGYEWPKVFSVAVQADGKVLVGGSFTTLGGQARTNIGRLNADGTLDAAFNPGVGRWTDIVSSLAVQADGKVLVGGFFWGLVTQPSSGTARFNPDGSLDTGFDPGSDGPAYSLAVQADGKILVGGQFTTLNGEPRNGIGRLNPNGTLDAGFNPGDNTEIFSAVYSLAVQTDGKILVGGSFIALRGQPRFSLGRLNADGTPDAGFNPGVGRLGSWSGGDAWGQVYSLAVQADGKVLVGGLFGELAGQPRDCLGRLNATGPATESLTSDGSTITWLRGGTGPEVWRTTFEHSADGLTWIELGAGTRIPGGWQLIGISLPSGGTIRACGYVTGGSGFVGTTLADWSAIRLDLARDGSEVVLSWTGGQGPYQVQQTATPADPNSWQNAGEAVPSNSMRIPRGPTGQFFRVRGQP